jgi:predicted nucleotidyltransferase
MNKESKNISNKLPHSFIEVFEKIDLTAKQFNIEYFVIGATAMDILIKYYYENKLQLRTTQDIDISILINDWDMYSDFIKTLVDTYGFSKTSIEHRFTSSEISVDILPFGPLAKATKEIKWPRTNRTISVLGFEEAYNFSIQLQLKDNPPLFVNFASITGIAILKLIAWSDAYPERKRDAKDFFVLLNNYSDFGDIKRRFEEKTTLDNFNEDFDYYQASAMLLAYDIKRIATPNTVTEILRILDINGNKFEKLIIDIIGNNDFETNFEKSSRIISIFSNCLSK